VSPTLKRLAWASTNDESSSYPLHDTNVGDAVTRGWPLLRSTNYEDATVNTPAGLSALALLCALLTSCAAVDALNAQMLADQQAREAAFIESVKRTCEKYGFRPSTDTFAQCMQTEVNNIKTREAMAAEASRTREAIESAARKSTTENSMLQKSTTTNCVTTVLGVRCTTQ
jgi:hypothetical protein